MLQSRRAQTGTAAPITTSHVAALDDIVYGGGSSHGGSGAWYQSTPDGGLVTSKTGYQTNIGQGGNDGGDTDVMGRKINIGDQGEVDVSCCPCSSNAATVGTEYIGIRASSYWNRNPTVDINAGCVKYLSCLDIARNSAVNIKAWYGGDAPPRQPWLSPLPGGNTVEIVADSSHWPSTGDTHVRLEAKRHLPPEQLGAGPEPGTAFFHLSGKARTADPFSNATQVSPMQDSSGNGGWLRLGPIGPPPTGSAVVNPTLDPTPGLECRAAGQIILSADQGKPETFEEGIRDGGGVEMRMGGKSDSKHPGNGCVVFDYTGRESPGLGEIWIIDGTPGTDAKYSLITFAGNPGDDDPITNRARFEFHPSNGPKTFIIPHPLDNLRDSTELLHSCIEAPTVDNIYRGSCRLINGKGTVNLDSNDRYQMTQGTFQALNKDPQVHITNNESFDRVRGEIVGNELHIICENPDSDANVAWLVIGTRQDPSIRECPKTNDAGDLITERPRN